MGIYGGKIMSIYEYLKNNNSEVMFVERTGTLVAVYLKNNIKVIFEYKTIGTASRKLTQMRRSLEGKKV